MPTAVMMLSTEKTMSIMMIWTRPARRPSGAAGFLSASSPSGSTRWWISAVAFQSRNRPPASSSRSRTEKGCPSTVASGSVKRTTHDAEASSARRNTRASDRPSLRARPLRRSSTRFVSSAMKTRLSRPRTTSMAIRGRERRPGVWVLREAEKIVHAPLSPQSVKLRPPRQPRAPQSRAPQRVSKLGPEIAGSVQRPRRGGATGSMPVK